MWQQARKPFRDLVFNEETDLVVPSLPDTVRCPNSPSEFGACRIEAQALHRHTEDIRGRVRFTRDRVREFARDIGRRSASFEGDGPWSYVARAGLALRDFYGDDECCPFASSMRDDLTALFGAVGLTQARALDSSLSLLFDGYRLCMTYSSDETCERLFAACRDDVLSHVRASDGWFGCLGSDVLHDRFSSFPYEHNGGSAAACVDRFRNQLFRAMYDGVQERAALIGNVCEHRETMSRLAMSLVRWPHCQRKFDSEMARYVSSFSNVRFDEIEDRVRASGSPWSIIEEGVLVKRFRQEWAATSASGDADAANAFFDRALCFWRAHRTGDVSGPFLPDRWCDWLDGEYAVRARQACGYAEPRRVVSPDASVSFKRPAMGGFQV